MLDVLAVLSHDGWSKLRKALAKLWEDLGSHEILDRLFASVLGIDIYVKLYVGQYTCLEMRKMIKGCERRERTTYSSSSVSCATSGMVIVPLASSPSLFLPAD